MEVKYTEEFKKDLEKLTHWKYAPLRWWKSFKRIPKEIKWKYQRMTRGWADCDVWNIDWYLIDIVPDMLRTLKENKIGHPAHLSPEEWSEKLDKMIESFEAAKKLKNLDYVEGHDGDSTINEVKRDNLKKKFDEGWQLMGEYFFHLWD